ITASYRIKAISGIGGYVSMKTIQRLYKHLYWADGRILEGLRAAGTGDGKMVRLFAHILQSEQVWLTRLQGRDSHHLRLWEETELAECARLAEHNRSGFTMYLGSLTEADLDRMITYRNQTGKEYSTSIRDILTHLAMHGQ